MPVSAGWNHDVNLKFKNSFLSGLFSRVGKCSTVLSSDVNSAFRVMEENRFSLKLASEVCERQHGRVHERLTRGRETHIGYSYPFCLCVCLCVNDGKIKELFIAVETIV